MLVLHSCCPLGLEEKGPLFLLFPTHNSTTHTPHTHALATCTQKQPLAYIHTPYILKLHARTTRVTHAQDTLHTCLTNTPAVTPHRLHTCACRIHHTCISHQPTHVTHHACNHTHTYTPHMYTTHAYHTHIHAHTSCMHTHPAQHTPHVNITRMHTALCTYSRTHVLTPSLLSASRGCDLPCF